MNGKIFVDTSAWLAYSIPKDPYHKEFTRLFNEAVSSRSPLFTSNDVADETYTRFRYDSGWNYAKQFINHLQRALQTKSVVQLWIDESVQAEAFALAEKYKDHKLSLTDISSAVLMKNFHITTVFTLDSKHFTALGFKALPIV